MLICTCEQVPSPLDCSCALERLSCRFDLQLFEVPMCLGSHLNSCLMLHGSSPRLQTQAPKSLVCRRYVSSRLALWLCHSFVHQVPGGGGGLFRTDGGVKMCSGCCSLLHMLFDSFASCAFVTLGLTRHWRPAMHKARSTPRRGACRHARDGPGNQGT